MLFQKLYRNVLLSTNNEAKRAKIIAEIKSRYSSISDLLTAEVEQALVRAATGYTVTEHIICAASAFRQLA